ncbi:MAG: phosphoribosyl-AMP cyclohydrolase [Verrucomicrobiota bacterium JB022]|nr:phosphoribosyl-AMP cyclohydrolase [Verrucomicrobiota bacterium JB022]
MTHHELEEGSVEALDFTKLNQIGQQGLHVIPAVAQEVETGDVVMLGYVNREALEAAQRERKAVFWSTSRNELWIKGLTSGNYLELEDIRVNCEQNSILYRVRLRGDGACHTLVAGQKKRHRRSCYYRRLGDDGKLEMIEE